MIMLHATQAIPAARSGRIRVRHVGATSSNSVSTKIRPVVPVVAAVKQTGACMRTGHADVTHQPSPEVHHVDFLVLGSGIAGLSFALKVADYGTVALVTKAHTTEGCTQYAQGGVCSVLDANDSVASHVHDTLVAGAFLNDVNAVEVVCREGPASVLELVEFGARFTRNLDGSLHLTREGGHTNRRVVHADDLTGREIERALVQQVENHPNVTIFEHHLAVDLITEEYGGILHCFGADVLNQQAKSMTRFVALTTMLACGGAGQLYPSTTNPSVATGDGIAMAYRAHAAIANLEFVQFHPTALYTPPAERRGSAFLITEALRGEGGVLLNLAGERFMSSYDAKRMELAPRDVVARAIHDQMKLRGDAHVLLDISHRPKSTVLQHFPNIAAHCSELGIDITEMPIPVLPAQHYTCGGVQTGLLGETNIQGLYACGEVACSGLHGANRLASNSLLEGLVFANRAAGPSIAHAEYAARHCCQQLTSVASSRSRIRPLCSNQRANIAAWASARRAELTNAMWQYCGIVRRTQELVKVLDIAVEASVDAETILHASGVSTEVLELFNLATVAELTVSSALMRKESRGGHYNVDFPMSDDQFCRPSIIHFDQTRSGAAKGSRRQGQLPIMSVIRQQGVPWMDHVELLRGLQPATCE